MASAAQTLAAKTNATSSPNVILPGQQDTFTTLEAMLRQQFAPEPGYQEFVFNRILHAAWNQHRCECAEVVLQSESPNPNRDILLCEESERKLRQLRSYGKREQQSFNRYVKELRALQNEARYRRETAVGQKEPSVLTEVQKIDAAVENSESGKSRRTKSITPETCHPSLRPLLERLQEKMATNAEGFRLRDIFPR